VPPAPARQHAEASFSSRIARRAAATPRARASPATVSWAEDSPSRPALDLGGGTRRRRRTCEEELARLRHELQVDDLADLDRCRRGREAEQCQGGEHRSRHRRCHCRCVGLTRSRPRHQAHEASPDSGSFRLVLYTSQFYPWKTKDPFDPPPARRPWHEGQAGLGARAHWARLPASRSSWPARRAVPLCRQEARAYARRRCSPPLAGHRCERLESAHCTSSRR